MKKEFFFFFLLVVNFAVAQLPKASSGKIERIEN
jgi:hypothetical protein